eukprot:g611.t1
MLSRLLERARSVAESALDGNVGKTAEDVGELARGRSKEAIERLRQRAQGLAETTARGIDDRLHRSRDNVRKRARGLAENVTQASKDAARKMQVEVERGGKQAQDAAKVMASNAASIAREEVHNRAQKVRTAGMAKSEQVLESVSRAAAQRARRAKRAAVFLFFGGLFAYGVGSAAPREIRRFLQDRSTGEEKS